MSINKVSQILTVRKDTSSYTLDDIANEIEECQKILASLGYSDILKNEYRVTFNDRAVKIFGTCHKENLHFYWIEINKKFLPIAPPEGVHNLIMHEVIHSIDGCMNHGEKWQKAANSVNCNYEFTDITRTNYYRDYEKQVVKESYRWEIKCDNCGATWKYIRKPKVYASCSEGHARHDKCGGRKFTCKYIGK